MKITSFVEICPNMAQIVENFGKWVHSYTKICRDKGVIDTPVRLNLLPMIATHLITSFVRSTPQESIIASLFF